jgi:hypothetical protein
MVLNNIGPSHIKSNIFRSAFFDIGKVNFAFYIENTNLTKLEKLRSKYNSLPKKLKRRIKGPMNKDIESILLQLFKCGKSDMFRVYDIRHDKESKKLDNPTRHNLGKLLDKYRYIWDTCDAIVLEKQYFNPGPRRKKTSNGDCFGVNMDALKIAECCLFWFSNNYPDKIVVEFNASFKTQCLGAPDKLTKPQRKKWSIQKGKEILILRKEEYFIEEMNLLKNAKGKKQKLDDMLDCLAMAQAWLFRTFILIEL